MSPWRDSCTIIASAAWLTFRVDGVLPAAPTLKPSASHDGVESFTPLLAISGVSRRASSRATSWSLRSFVGKISVTPTPSQAGGETEMATPGTSHARCVSIPARRHFTRVAGLLHLQEQPRAFPPQHGCTCCSLCLACFSRRPSMALPHFLPVSAPSAPFQETFPHHPE